jgi:hypothetical protein
LVYLSKVSFSFHYPLFSNITIYRSSKTIEDALTYEILRMYLPDKFVVKDDGIKTSSVVNIGISSNTFFFGGVASVREYFTDEVSYVKVGSVCDILKSKPDTAFIIFIP